MAPRRFKAHRQGCWIEATGSGLLRLRFRWRLPTATGLHKFSETTDALRYGGKSRHSFQAGGGHRGGNRCGLFRLLALVSEWQQSNPLPTNTTF